MTHTRKFKAPIQIAVALLGVSLALSACKASTDSTGQTPTKAVTTSEVTNLPPIRKALSCLPNHAAILAAHRGTDQRWSERSENSVSSLEALIEHGSLMAEIDVAGLKDGGLITFHDGVWDELSTRKGPIASTTTPELEKILLKSRDGKLTSDRPPLFKDILATAKGKLYLEVDFKSSANPKDVIAAIRKADMADQVLLIAYNPKQAALFERLAPDMLRSNPQDATKSGHAVWLGYNVANGNSYKSLKEKGNYIIGRIGDPKRQPPLAELRNAADILVTDEAERYQGIIGLNTAAKTKYEACLVE